MITLIRRLLGLGAGISRERAIEIAKEHCRDEGWPWVEPIYVREGLREYSVVTRADMRGGNVYVRMNRGTGDIVGAGRARR